jgi:hypothetical protein
MKAETMERVFSVKVLKILNICLYRQQANESGTYSLLGGGLCVPIWILADALISDCAQSPP